MYAHTHTYTERRLKNAGHLEKHSNYYFNDRLSHGLYRVEDDHVPFLERGKAVWTLKSPLLGYNVTMQLVWSDCDVN